MSKIFAAVLAFFGFAGTPDAPAPPPAPKTYTVVQSDMPDEKAVFATIQSANIVPARARNGGTILELKIRQGDHVEAGQVVATVGDQKLSLQVTSYAAQVQAAQTQVDQARVEFERAQRLIESGAISRNAFDAARTAYDVAQANLKSITAQRSVVQQQQREADILAPTAGRVLTVPVTAGTVVMPGETVATVAEQHFVMRLEIPERHARYMRVGDPVRLNGTDLGLDGSRFGKITLVYPQIEQGHVVADAEVSGVSDYFVGQRVQVWVTAGTRKAIVIPKSLIVTRYGIDYVRLWTQQNGAIDVPVQRGQAIALPDGSGGLEILSGLKPGDRLLNP